MVNAFRKFTFLLAALLALTCLLFPFAGWAGDGELCDRKAFGDYVQRNLKDTRARVLEARSIHPVSFRIGSGGRRIVESGSWEDPFSGATLLHVSASNVQIDHVIPVCWAWKHGAEEWDRSKRREFYNDERFLVVVAAGLNAYKGDRGPSEFMPWNQELACKYLRVFQAGTTEYGLRLTERETTQFEELTTSACAFRTAEPR